MYPTYLCNQTYLRSTPPLNPVSVVIEQYLARFFLPQSSTHKALAKFVCLVGTLTSFSAISPITGSFSLGSRQVNFTAFSRPFPSFAFCPFDFPPLVLGVGFSLFRLFLFDRQIGHCALKWSVFLLSEEAALFSVLPQPVRRCSESPFKLAPSALAKRDCLSSKFSFLPLFP